MAWETKQHTKVDSLAASRAAVVDKRLVFLDAHLGVLVVEKVGSDESASG